MSLFGLKMGKHFDDFNYYEIGDVLPVVCNRVLMTRNETVQFGLKCGSMLFHGAYNSHVRTFIL